MEEENGGTKLELCEQEPRFSKLDIEFLQSKGFTVVDVDEALDHVILTEILIGHHPLATPEDQTPTNCQIPHNTEA